MVEELLIVPGPWPHSKPQSSTNSTAPPGQSSNDSTGVDDPDARRLPDGAGDTRATQRERNTLGSRSQALSDTNFEDMLNGTGGSSESEIRPSEDSMDGSTFALRLQGSRETLESCFSLHTGAVDNFDKNASACRAELPARLAINVHILTNLNQEFDIHLVIAFGFAKQLDQFSQYHISGPRSLAST